MISKNELKYYSSLLLKKFRERENKFIVGGTKLINEALDSGFYCEVVFYTNDFLAKHESDEIFSKITSIRCEVVKNSELSKLTDTKTPSSIVGIFHFKESNDVTAGRENLIVGLENISDPGNLGTILRNCDWFGINEIILSPDCTEVFNPKVIRSSAGSVFHLNIHEAENFYDELTSLKKRGFQLYCSDLNGENVFKTKWAEKKLILFSNEANGPTEKLLQISDHTITIPKFGKAESLNVANAAAVILAFLTRK